MSEEYVDDAREMIRLLASATNLDRLTVLDLEGCHMGNEGLAILAGAEHLRSVRKLTIESCGRYKHAVGEPGLRALASSRSLTNVTHLGCSDCVLGPAGVHQLLQWPGVEGLIELDLSYTDIDGTGAIELARCPRFKRLRRLCLDAFNLSDEALESLASAPWLPQLKELWIHAREIYGEDADQTDGALDALAAQLGPRLVMPREREEGFKLGTVGDIERIWHRLRRSQYRDETGLYLLRIL